MFLLQRLTGIITFVFIGIHLWRTRIQRALGHEVNFDMVHDIVTNPVWLIFIVCLLAVTFHFANGLWSFLVTWGILQSKNHSKSLHGFRLLYS